MTYFNDNGKWYLMGNEKEQKEAKQSKAAEIARKLFGVYDWQGVTEMQYGPSGLVRQANAFIKKNYPGTNWKVGETAFGDGESKYYIARI